MAIWNDRLLPHPLLAPWTDDYGEEDFVVSVPNAVLNNGKQISLTIKYHLTSPHLRQLIAEGLAEYVSLISCQKTFARHHCSTTQEDDVQVLDAAHYAQEIELAPYIVATQPVSGFTSPEFAEEIREIRPEGFDISPGCILAVGDRMDIALQDGGSPYSVIDLVPDSSVQPGSFVIGLDENRIKIHTDPEDKRRIEGFRQHGQGSREMAVLFPALYLHAVAEALRHIDVYADNHWARTMRKALTRHDITDDDEALKTRALLHAQQLMQWPMGTLLTAFGTGEEE